jgi:hypothetical protein
MRYFGPEPIAARTPARDFGMADNPNTADPGKSRRPWYQFRLRTLLIAVPLLATPCGYIAHEAKIVRARRAFLEEQYQESKDRGPVHVGPPLLFYGDTDQQASYVRRWLGDTGQWIVVVRASAPLAEKQAAAALFPEAGVMERP